MSNLPCPLWLSLSPWIMLAEFSVLALLSLALLKLTDWQTRLKQNRSVWLQKIHTQVTTLRQTRRTLEASAQTGRTMLDSAGQLRWVQWLRWLTRLDRWFKAWSS